MKPCVDCGKPLTFTWNHGSRCPSCQGKRTGAVNRAKVEKHGKAYFDRRSEDARRNA